MVVGEPAAAASRVAAGMLAPITETSFTEQLLLPLNLASMQRYEAFAAEVEEASGLPAGLSRTPTVSVAYDSDDVARLMVLKDFLDRIGLKARAAVQPRCPTARAAAVSAGHRRFAGRGGLELSTTACSGPR